MTTELDMQRKQTQFFIDGNPVEVVLQPNARVRQPNGGWKYQAGHPRPPQRVRVVELSPAFTTSAVIHSADGVERSADYQIVAPYDAEVEVGDTFMYQDTPMEVVHVDRTNQYEVRAPATRRLDPP